MRERREPKSNQNPRYLRYSNAVSADGEPTPASIDQIRRIERVAVLGGVIDAYRHAA